MIFNQSSCKYLKLNLWRRKKKRIIRCVTWMVKKEEKDWHNTKRMKCLKKTLCLLNYQVQGSFCTEQWVFFLKKNFLHDHEYTWRNLIFQLNNTLCQCLSLQYSNANIYSDNECRLVEKTHHTVVISTQLSSVSCFRGK